MTPRELWRRLAGAFGGGPRRADLVRELAFHREMLEAEHRARGLDADAARRAAALDLGGGVQIAEAWEDQRGLPFLEALRLDVRYGVRMLRRAPGFTAAALTTLALGIGATTAIFSVVDAVLLRPLPFADPGRLVTIGDQEPDGSSSNVGFATVVDWRARNQSFEDIAVMRLWMPTLVSAGEAERLTGVRVSWNYFAVLGVRPLIGRTFAPVDDRPEDWFSVLLSEGLWRRRFGADPDIVGRSIMLNGRPYRVLGVMPATFEGLDAQRYYAAPPQLWAALGYDARNGAASGACRSCQHLRAFGRLKAGVTLAAATGEMNAIREELRRAYPAEYETGSIAIVPLHQALTGRARPALLVLLAGVGFVLVMACANVASLQLARAAARRHELMLRAALGAGRARVVRQLLTESLVLAGAGAAAGAAVAEATVRGLIRMAPVSLPRLDQAGLDWRVLMFAIVTAIAAGMLAGLAPALRGAAASGEPSLVLDARGSTGAPSRLRTVLVVADFALALVLLTGAGLMLRTVAAMTRVDPGFRAGGVLSMQFSLAGNAFQDNESLSAFQRLAVAGLRALPDADGAALAGQIPFGGVQDCWGFHAQGRMQPNTADDPCVDRYGVTSDYLQVMGIPLLAGRTITDADNETGAPVILVSRSTAARVWGSGNPIGSQVRIGGATSGSWRTVVGIVADVHHDDLTVPPAPAMYTPELQIPSAYLTAIIRSHAGNPSGLAQPARDVLRGLNASVPVYGVAPLSALVGRSAAERVFVMRLLAGFAGIALVLAAVGLYGVVSYTVAQRSREVGVRMALGAQRQDVVRLVLSGALPVVSAGLVVGLAAALSATRYLESLLFGVNPADLISLSAASLMLAAIALTAHWVPVRRALRIDPAIALRAE
jgi:putative ABC transport system permease protein